MAQVIVTRTCNPVRTCRPTDELWSQNTN